MVLVLSKRYVDLTRERASCVLTYFYRCREFMRKYEYSSVVAKMLLFINLERRYIFISHISRVFYFLLRYENYK